MIDKLEMFIALAQESHFGRAASKLGITQPTLSAGIKSLEEHLGVQLVFRGSRFQGLTPEGQQTLLRARQLVKDARLLREEMRASHLGLSGQLRIAVIPTALIWAARLSASFAKKHPNVKFTILSRTSAQILDMLDTLEVDAGISYLDNEPLGRVRSQPLYTERFVLVCSREADIATQTSVSWAEVAGLPLCLLTPDMQNRRIINQRFMEAGLSPSVHMQSNSTVALTAQVELGNWVTVLPFEMAEFLTRGKPLKMVPIEPQKGKHKVGLFVPHHDTSTPMIDALLKAAAEENEVD